MTQQTKFFLIGLPLLLAFVVFARGCGHYGTVNELAFEHAKALYSVCNRKDSQRLEVCSKMIEEASSASRISNTETTYLNDIIATARRDQWNEALAMTRQLMVDQIEH